MHPRVVYWDADARKDLLVGQADGKVKLFLNVNTDEAPLFDSGTFLQVGEPGSKTDVDVGSRATPTVVDWNNDGKKDLVVGSYTGHVQYFINEGTDTEPDFLAAEFVQNEGGDLVVDGARSSPHVLDLCNDGKKDLLTGNTAGQLLFYMNTGTDESPSFSGYELVEADSVVIDLPGTPRTRPFVCDWTGDGLLDVLLGAGDGLVRLYQGTDPLSGVAPAVVESPARLLPAYPNPFNPRVHVPLELRTDGRVRVAVHDVSGRRVTLLADGRIPEGRHLLTWTGKDSAGRDVPSGVYFVRMEFEGAEGVAKIVLLR